MPELPEVETIRRELGPLVVGRTIVGVEVEWEGSIARLSREEFEQGMRGRHILSLRRRGKYLLFDLSGGWTLLVHLGMTGALLLKPSGGMKAKHDRVLFLLDDGQGLHFEDMRKFGRLSLVRDEQEVVGHLGPEPLALDPPGFRELMGRRRGMIKPLLLNQRFLAGLGNIYVDEVLFEARLHPLRRVESLSRKEIRALYRAIQGVLKQALGDRGTTFDGAYRRPDERLGEHQERLRVYGRKGEPCPRCKTPIARIEVGGRGTYLCPRCQA